MNENWKDLKVSEGEEILSLNEFAKKGKIEASLKQDLSKNNLYKDATFNQDSVIKVEKKEEGVPAPSNYFTDMEEITSPELVNIYNQEQKSKIQSIEFTNTESFFPKLFDTVSENINQKLVDNKNGTVSLLEEEVEEVTQKIEQHGTEKTKNIKPIIKKYKITEFKSKDSKDIEEIPTEENVEFLEKKEIENEKKEDSSEVDFVEELEETEELTELAEEIDDTEYLVSLIKDGEIKYPGKIDLKSIDKNLGNLVIPESKEEISSSDVIEGEMFGVKRAEVFYHIDKEIYAKRMAKRLDISKIKNLKSGIFLPLLVGIISFTLLLLVQPLLYLYFQKSSNASLEENVIMDSSILAKIAKQKEEEARRAQARLEEERRKLEYEKSRIENTINEELLKKQMEIENQFKQKYAELEKKGLAEKEYAAMKKQLEEEKALALQKAEEEKNKKIQEQQKILEEKNKEIKEAEDKLKKAIENKEYEIASITKSMQEQIQAKEREREEVSKRLREINELNQKIKEFNDIVYQLISGAIDEFKNNNIEQGLVKLNTVLKYYEGRIDFVLSNSDLKNKMQTDIFFVQTISRLVQETKSSAIYNKEFINIVNKFKRITEYYKNAENYYTKRDWGKANEEYSKVLVEFDEVNFSYNRLKEIEKQIQNLKALDTYNKAIDNMKNNRYELAISQFTSIVRETPLSDYASLAVNSLIELTNRLLPKNIIAEANKNAKPIFEMANKSYETKNYDEAIALYDSILTKYPMSDYVKQSYSNIVMINQIKSKGDAALFENKLRDNFRKEYSKFFELYKKGNFSEAREYYFKALNSAFANYTDDSIMNFKKEEDQYIATLTSSSDKNLQALLEKTRKEVENEFNKRIEAQKNSYENQIAQIRLDFEKRIKDLEGERDRIKNDYIALRNSSSSKEEIEAIKKSYDAEIAKKDKEIADLNKKYNDSVNYIKELRASLESEKNKIVKEKEDILKQKDIEIENLKKRSEEAKSYAEKVRLDIENEKNKLLTEKDSIIAAKTKEIENLKIQYQNITNSYNKLKNELEVNKKQLIEERDKLKNENSILLTEKNKLTEENKKLTNEIAQLKKERENLIKNYSEMSKTDIEKERAQFLKDKERLENDNKALVSQIETLKSEKDKIIQEYTEKLKNASTKDINEITKKYEAIISQKDKEIEQIKSNSNLLTEENSKLKTENTNLNNELTKLREERDRLIKEYTDKLKDATSGKELIALKKKYDDIIAEKDKEIENLKTRLANMNITDDNKIREELANKEIELKNERENNAKLKEQLVESYKKYTELEKLNIMQNEKIQANYKKELDELQKKYKELEYSYNKYKDEQPYKYQEIENRVKEQMEKKILLEKEKLTNQFMKEIERLNSIIDAEQKLNKEKITKKEEDSKKSDSKILTTSNKYFGRITELNGNYITFQFFTTELISYVKKGDEIEIVRVITMNNSKTEVFVGKVEITNINNVSLFGIAKVIYFENNNVIKTGDLLKK